MAADPTGLATKLVGAVWGHLVGDAVGVPYEFRSPSQIDKVIFGAEGTHHQPAGTWSDDGALMLALLDSLLAVGFDTHDQAHRALAWHREGAYTPNGDGAFDIGNTTRSALGAIERGVAAEDAGPGDERSSGNGSLMRILPLALVERDIPEGTLIDHAHRASRVTHGNERPQVACALYSLVARRLLRGKGGRVAALTDALRFLRAAYEAAPDSHAHLQALDHLEAWTERAGRGRVWDSFWSAWEAFVGASSYRDTIERAIRYGNDTDTTAAIAGGLAGVYWGVDGIPAEWLAGMRGREIVAPLVDRLLATAGWKTTTLNPIRVNWVDLANVPRLRGWPGRLGMTFLPGKQRDGWSGLHWRDLETDARRLRNEQGVGALVLLVEDAELAAARAQPIVDVLTRHDIEVDRYPVQDMSVPTDREGFRNFLDATLDRLRGGQSIVVVCRGGLGRTGTVVGCLLRDGGLDSASAIRLTRETRPKTIENDRQEAFIRAWDWPDRPLPAPDAAAPDVPVLTAADRQPGSPPITEISFEVDGLPPLKGEAKSLLAEGHQQAARVRSLLAAAMLAAGPDFRTWTGPIGLELRVGAPSFVGVGDATNQLGGVGDVLQARRSRLVDTAHLNDLARVALFRDDAQIAEIRYSRQDAPAARYWIRVWML